MKNANVPKIWRDSLLYSSTAIATIMTVMDVSGLSLGDTNPPLNWWSRLLVILFAYLLITTLVRLYIGIRTHSGLNLDIRGISVKIKQGDLFRTKGWKVIPFNEYFDTIVDDKVISRNSLNGIFLENHVSDICELREVVRCASNEPSYFPPITKNGETIYPLGRIIAYKDYLLLAFSHFDEHNVAHLSKPEYEQCLFNMWKEIRRVYSNKPIYLPLIGSGLTSFDDLPQKSNIDLLKCILCTLNSSGENINQTITIVLTADMMKKTKIYEAKGILVS